MTVKVSDSIKDCSISWLDLGIEKISFDTNVMISGKYLQGDATANCIENSRQFIILLPGKRRDTVFDISQKYEHIRICRIDSFQQMFEPISTPAPEMQAMGSEISLYAKMEIRNNQ
jgi:hypothetical protein